MIVEGARVKLRPGSANGLQHAGLMGAIGVVGAIIEGRRWSRLDVTDDETAVGKLCDEDGRATLRIGSHRVAQPFKVDQRLCERLYVVQRTPPIRKLPTLVGALSRDYDTCLPP